MAHRQPAEERREADLGWGSLPRFPELIKVINVGPPLLALVAIVENFFLIQNPVTVLTVRYCGKFFAPPQKNLKNA